MIRDVSAAGDDYANAASHADQVIRQLTVDPVNAISIQLALVKDDVRSGKRRARGAFAQLPSSVATAIADADHAYRRANDAFRPIAESEGRIEIVNLDTTVAAMVKVHPELMTTVLEESRATKRAANVLRSWVHDHDVRSLPPF